MITAIPPRNEDLKKQRKRCIKKFLYYFPKGFADKKYKDWERNYKLEAHIAWQQQLSKQCFETLLKGHAYEQICEKAVKVESATNLLFSFEKMALRDAVKSTEGAKDFAKGVYDYVFGDRKIKDRFENFTSVLASLPRKQTRVLTWPLQTVFGFIANPSEHIFVKPRVTQNAAAKYRHDLRYSAKPNWVTYEAMLSFATLLKQDLAELKPVDMIDIQSFIWVLGSAEYPD